MDDTLIVWKLSRLARSLTHVIKTVSDINERNIALKVLTKNIKKAEALLKDTQNFLFDGDVIDQLNIGKNFFLPIFSSRPNQTAKRRTRRRLNPMVFYVPLCRCTHHSLKRALNFNRRGEITDRTSENQHLRMMHLNLLAAIIIYWNTKHLGRIIHDMGRNGIIIPPGKLAHLSPLGWEHIILTGYYRW